MLVYRLCKEVEIIEVLKSKKFKNVGKCFKPNKNTNTHKYMNGVKYLHFFDDMANLFHFDTAEGYYICTYDIPYQLLDEYKGIGYYLDLYNFKTFEQVVEYAIPGSQLSFDYLMRIEEIKEDMDFDDFLYNSMNNKLITIYQNDKKEDNKKGRLVLIRRKNELIK